MDILATYKIGITILIPFLSAIACGILVAFSLQDCLKRDERKLKRIVLFYLSMSGIGWFVMFCYEFNPIWFVWLNVACLASFLLPAIFFYRIIRFLTRLEQPEDFSVLHYLLPGALLAAMLIWSLFVPFDVQLLIVKEKAQVLPAGYEAFARFFTLKPLLRVVFGLVYYLLVILMLVSYYKRATCSKRLLHKPAKWVVFLVGISLASLFSSILPTFMPRGEVLYSIWTFMVALSIAAQHVLLSYHIIRRDYLPYIIHEEEEKQKPSKVAGKLQKQTRQPQEQPEEIQEPPQETPEKPPRRQHSGKLNRRRFENFIRNKKPYLNPDYKMTDLVEDMDVNRTALSAFINRTYGMNFNRYLNRLRIQELVKLRSQPENQGKSIRSLTDKAGFKYFRYYLRAVAAERKENTPEGETDEEKGGEE
ncbi:AraC family transcriptional regulator [Bacteroides hominis]|uniref:AraC family transcriptional regulator n=1 Tax=Bacteroides hominis TaxID=2763023 RepID=UPI002105F9BD|nr:AraC family transcriptional regulator [Bacteroides hominis (ex Liu et al. 2022)]